MRCDAETGDAADEMTPIDAVVSHDLSSRCGCPLTSFIMLRWPDRSDPAPCPSPRKPAKLTQPPVDQYPSILVVESLAMAHPATRHSTDQIYSVLRADVISGALKPREAMSEARMALRFGVSRTPVREAFKRLVDEGFLVAVPQVGTFVAPIDLAAVRDSQFIRETLECRTVVLAAQRISDADCRRLAAQIEEQAEAVRRGERSEIFRLDEVFHAEISRIAGHRAVWSMIEGVKAQMDRVRCLSLETPSWSEVILNEHRIIAACVMKHDAKGAEAAMRAHLRTVFATIDTIAKDHADAFDDSRLAHDAS
ncbi:GntR family transcriptional regulator [Bosea beijingensis]